MTNNYVLVNPHIEGQFKSKINAPNSVEAGKQFYKSLSEHFNNAVPKFHFTIQKGGSGNGKYYHFKVKENRNADDVSFSLEPFNIVGNFDEHAFKNKLGKIKNKVAQIGGKNKKSKKVDDSSSDSEVDSDSSSDSYTKINTYVPVLNQPIYYWWYDPLIYKLDSYYIPTFYAYMTPIIEINTLF
jgi:hypothetical protein